MKDEILGALLALFATMLVFFIPIVVFLIGPFLGWVSGTVVGWVFEDTIRQVLRAFGVDLGFLTMGQLGATLGFVGAFFRSVVVQKK